MPELTLPVVAILKENRYIRKVRGKNMVTGCLIAIDDIGITFVPNGVIKNGNISQRG